MSQHIGFLVRLEWKPERIERWEKEHDNFVPPKPRYLRPNGDMTPDVRGIHLGWATQEECQKALDEYCEGVVGEEIVATTDFTIVKVTITEEAVGE